MKNKRLVAWMTGGGILAILGLGGLFVIHPQNYGEGSPIFFPDGCLMFLFWLGYIIFLVTALCLLGRKIYPIKLEER